MKRGPAKVGVSLIKISLEIFLSKATRPTALIFGMYHHLGVFYKACSNYALRVKKGAASGLVGFTLSCTGKSSSDPLQNLFKLGL